MKYNWIQFQSSDISRYIDFIALHPDTSIWHQPDWLQFQLKSGRATGGFCFGIESEGSLICVGMLLIQPIAVGMVQGYIPAGILYFKMDPELFNYLLDALLNNSYWHGLMFIQADAQMPFDQHFATLIAENRKLVTGLHLSIPSWTLQVDLTEDEEQILAQMKPKGRYNIRLAAKKGVEIRTGSASEVSIFYRLLSDTTRRDGFSGNPEVYYRTLLETLPQSRLFIAEHEGEALAAGIFCYYGRQALYYYGASSNTKRNLMAPYLLQWYAMQEGRRRGCRIYDFLGIAEPGNEKDPLTGVTDFKLKFGGDVVRLNPSFRIVYKPLLFAIYNMLRFVKNIFNR